MGDVAIRVEGLGKQYRLGGQQERYSTLRDQIRKWTSVRTLLSRAARSERRPRFWALKDVSFEVKRGEVVGIIGRNGAGKSTLLKILSRITEPTEGEVDIYGRVGSLLEVGTGFNPELTGRENIYLNGAILGMRRTEITRKFDEIVAFAEVEKFIDTQVKHYSSGMYMRLAFAVAAHLEPEILIVDEVLAVGDAEFQKKCLGKMGEVAKGGRTVLFVSHNIGAIRNLCTSGVLLKEGRTHSSGQIDDILSIYTRSNRCETESKPIQRPSWARNYIQAIRTLNSAGDVRTEFEMGDDIWIEMNVLTPPSERIQAPVMGIVVSHATNGVLGGVNTRMTGAPSPSYICDGYRICARIKSPPLLPGYYEADIWLGDGQEDLDVALRGACFQIQESDVYGTGRTPIRTLGSIFFRADWAVHPARSEAAEEYK
jgi:lipopolysaccharide transport system ATP-binding protein